MASKRGVRRRECGNKVGHDSLDQALYAIAKMHKKMGWQGQMTTYRCKHCNKIHVGHARGQNSSLSKGSIIR